MDLPNGALYWTEPAYHYGEFTPVGYLSSPGFIKRSDTNGQGVQNAYTTAPDHPTIFTTSDFGPWDLSIDAGDGQMYWTEEYHTGYYQSASVIRRSNLNGSNVETLLTYQGEYGGYGAMTVDAQNDYFYYVENSDITEIKRTSFDGSITETVVPMDYTSGLSPIDLDIFNNKFYWIDYNGSLRIRSSNLDGSDVVTLAYADNAWAFDVAASGIYWIGEDKITRADLNGENIETIIEIEPITGDFTTVPITDIGSELAIDSFGGKIYWIESGPNRPFALPDRIMRANLDGTDIEEVVTEGLVKPTTIEFVGANPGDADLDGDVDLSDLSILASNYGLNEGASWWMGSFDSDGDVDLNDLSLLASNYGSGAAQAFADFQSIPEPSMLLAMSMAAPLLMGRRRRNHL